MKSLKVLKSALFSITAVLCAIFLTPTQGQTQADVRFVNEFLNIGVGAKAHGMFGSVSATVDDISAAYWNPAGLARIESPAQINAMHASWFGGIANYDYVAFGKRFNDSNNSYGSVTLIRLGVDNIPNTLNLLDDDGTVNFNNVTEFSAADYAFFLSYGQDLGIEGLSIGGSGKIIYRNIGSFGNAFGFGFDLGLQYKVGNFSFGLMGRDITTTINNWSFSLTEDEIRVFQREGNEVPVSSTEIALPKIVLGAAYKIDNGTRFTYLIEGDFRFSSDGTKSGVFSGENIGIDPTAGIEVGYDRKVFFRAGIGNFQNIINENADAAFEFTPNIGLGIDLGLVNIDYALTNIGSVSGVLVSHVFSLRLDLHGDRL